MVRNEVEQEGHGEQVMDIMTEFVGIWYSPLGGLAEPGHGVRLRTGWVQIVCWAPYRETSSVRDFSEGRHW